jgi:1,2-diacylglycerol 3-alpha-glucosyltransferase
MRIGMMTDVYKPHVSGITNFISLNKRYLENSGCEVFVFTVGDEDYVDDETNIIRSPGFPLLDTGYYISLRYNQRAHRLLNSMDVVHVQHPFLSGSLALRYCRQRGIPIVFTNHTRYDLYAQAYLPNVPDVIGETALQAYLPVFCRSCDLVIAPSAGMRDVLVKFGVDTPVEVVPNGVELQRFRDPVQPFERSSVGFSPDNVVLVYVGRIGPEKNLPFLLRAFAGAYQAYEHARLLLIGDGPEWDNLQDRVRHMGLEGKVYFAGMLSYDQIPGYLAMADAFLTASVTEVHPLSVIEAMAAGLPVLGICSPGVGDIVQDGETGLLVAEEELAGFTAKLVRMIVDSDARRRMGQQARLASEAYSINRTTQLMLECYKKVIQQSTGRKRGLSARVRRMLDGFQL